MRSRARVCNRAPSHLDVEIIDAVLVEHRGCLLPVFPEFDGAEEHLGRNLGHVVSKLLLDDGVTSRGEDEELRDHFLLLFVFFSSSIPFRHTRASTRSRFVSLVASPRGGYEPLTDSRVGVGVGMWGARACAVNDALKRDSLDTARRLLRVRKRKGAETAKGPFSFSAEQTQRVIAERTLEVLSSILPILAAEWGD